MTRNVFRPTPPVLVALLLAAACADAVADPSRLLAVDRDGNQLLVIDPATMTLLHRVDVGTGPHEVVGSADGRLAWVANYGTKEVVGDSLSVVDLDSGKEIERISVRPFLRPHGMEIAGDKLYFTAEGSRSVARLDLPSGAIDWTVGLGQTVSHMLDVAPGGARIYTANMLSDTVTAIDVGAAPNVPLQHASVGKVPEGIAVSPDGETVWVGQVGNGEISILDARTLQPRKQLAAGNHPARIRFSADGSRAFTVDPKTSELIVIDTAEPAVIRRVTVPGVPLGMWPSADGRFMYLTLAAGGKVARMDLQTFEIDHEVDVGRVADGIGWAGPG